VNFAKARDDVIREICLMSGRHIICSTGIPVKQDGLPYASFREPADPGVAIYWTTPKGVSRVIACDAWRTVRENIRAVGLTVQGLRQIGRAGASEILDRAFQGFTALPEAHRAKPWRDVLGDIPLNYMAIDAAYRALAKIHHPDVGGTHDRMIEINQARADAMAELLEAGL
jgi:hypothetical protein